MDIPWLIAAECLHTSELWMKWLAHMTKHNKQVTPLISVQDSMDPTWCQWADITTNRWLSGAQTKRASLQLLSLSETLHLRRFIKGTTCDRCFLQLKQKKCDKHTSKDFHYNFSSNFMCFVTRIVGATWWINNATALSRFHIAAQDRRWVRVNDVNLCMLHSKNIPSMVMFMYFHYKHWKCL